MLATTCVPPPKSSPPATRSGRGYSVGGAQRRLTGKPSPGLREQDSISPFGEPRMNFFLQHSPLRDLYDKVVAGERLSDADALRLFESKDLNALGAIADSPAQKQGRQPRQLHPQPLHQLLELLHPLLPVLLVRPQEARRRRLRVEHRADRRESPRGAGAGNHGTAHRRRPSPLAAVQLLHRHAEGTAGAGWSPA
jgi:hypothetical protein